jgi:hypothetical protein
MDREVDELENEIVRGVVDYMMMEVLVVQTDEGYLGDGRTTAPKVQIMSANRKHIQSLGRPDRVQAVIGDER